MNNLKVENTKYYTLLAMLFVALLLTANTMGPKPLQLGFIILPAGLLVFPLTYLLAVILTEVYGFMPARKVIWTALACNLLMALGCRVAVMLPATESWPHQAAYANILGPSTRLMVLSVFTYLIGEFVNAYTVAKLKVKTKGRYFWMRALSGSGLGEMVETSLFIPLAFWEMPNHELLRLAFFYVSYKFGYAFCAMPLIHFLARKLKKAENIDYFDTNTNFNPFAVFSFVRA